MTALDFVAQELSKTDTRNPDTLMSTEEWMSAYLAHELGEIVKEVEAASYLDTVNDVIVISEEQVIDILTARISKP